LEKLDQITCLEMSLSKDLGENMGNGKSVGFGKSAWAWEMVGMLLFIRNCKD